MRCDRGRRQGPDWPRLLLSALIILATILLGAACSSEASTAHDSEIPTAINGLETRRLGPPALRVVSPEPGATVTSPVTIEIAIDNYNLAPKGISADGEGHVHVIEGTCIEPGEVISADHVHVGDGSASTKIDLQPGRRSLCVQLGDGFHAAVAITNEFEVIVEG